MVGDENGEALLAQVLDDLLHIMHGDGIHPTERFVEHEKRRVRDERAGNGETTLLTTGEREGLVLGDVLDAETGEKLVAAFFAGLLGKACCFQYGENIFFNREFAEDRFLLGKIAHSVAGPAIHRHGCDIFATEENFSAIRAHETNDHVKSRCLSCAVRAEKPNDLAFFDIDIDAIHHRPAVVDLHQALGVEERFFRCFAHWGFAVSVIIVLLPPMVRD